MNIKRTQPAIRVDHVSKKFARSLKRAMWYGLQDIARAALIPQRFRSVNFDSRVADALAPQPSNSRVPGIELRSQEFWALDDITFDVAPGECVGLIGANGAGKSTLFSVLSGIYGPTAGRVEILGKLQALIALGAGFHPMLTGRENVYINGAVLGLSQKQIGEKLERILAFAELGDFIDSPIRNYSSGMLVRLGFSVAAHMDPDILLIDEVLAVGDAAFQAKCQEYSRQLVNSGKTILVVSHNMIVIQAMCSRTLWLNHGELVEDGATPEVTKRYKEFMISKAESGASLTSSQSFPIMIRDVELLDETGCRIERPLFGRPLRARIHLYAGEGVPCGRIWFQVVDCERDREVVGASMYQDGHYLRFTKGDNIVTVTFGNTPLGSGSRFRICVGIRDWMCQAMLAESFATPSFDVDGVAFVCENGIGEAKRIEGITNPVVVAPYRWAVEKGALLGDNDILVDGFDVSGIHKINSSGTRV
jgi:lipopolysaccharide transport system ATP-binding protein